MVSRISPGDEAVVYVTKQGKSLVSALPGLVRFTGPTFMVEAVDIFDQVYPLRIPFKSSSSCNKEIPFAPLVRNLEFITHKRAWGRHLQGQSVKEIAESDFEILCRALEDGTE